MTNDTISTMLTHLRNAIMAKHTYVCLQNTHVNYAIVGILKQEGFIKDFVVVPKKMTWKPARKKSSYSTQNELKIVLKYFGRFQRPAITHLKRVSSPGLRRYVSYKAIPSIFNNMGLTILTTSKGIMTDREARRAKMGGEMICSIY